MLLPTPNRESHALVVNSRGITLVELLIVISIMAVVGTMLVSVWIALSNSFANTTRSSDARDFTRQAASRMEREIRDSEAQLKTGHYQGRPAILWASPGKIMFVTTFNNAASDVPSTNPLAAMYYVEDGTLYMKRDSDDDGSWDDEQRRSLVSNIVNSSVAPGPGATPAPGGGTPLFTYTYIDENGVFTTAPLTNDLTNLAEPLRARIVSVTFTLLVDLNPGHTPTHMTLTTTAQLRNQRRF